MIDDQSGSDDRSGEGQRTTAGTRPRSSLAGVLSGTGYEQKTPSTHLELVQVGRGTPYGEVLRRYWQPVALASSATTVPAPIRILGEDLILFRTRRGVPGLLTPHCAHRGASLFYGGVEDDGIRCCYHGWVFDPQGRCLEQPCEPGGGRHRDRVRQPWYPLREYHGLLFAYMGPPDAMPDFIRWDVLEQPGPGEQVIADDNSFSGGGPKELDFNWLNHYEHVLDPFHVPILHARFSGIQFIPEMGIMPECRFAYTDQGVGCYSVRHLDDGRRLYRLTEAVFPNVRLVASPRMSAMGPSRLLGWVVPSDDTSFVIFTLARVTDPGALAGEKTLQGGKPWAELTPEEHQRYPGDYEAQSSQGALPVHSRETLATTDQGITMIRRLMAKQIRAVREGRDPIGVSRTGTDLTVGVKAGVWFGDAPWLSEAARLSGGV